MVDTDRIDIANGYTLMLADAPNKWRIVGPDGHDQGYVVAEADRLEAFADATSDAVFLAAKASGDAERQHLNRLVLQMLDHPEHAKDQGVRCGLALAATTIRRGRHLTEAEKLRNLAKALADADEDGGTPDDWTVRLTGKPSVGKSYEIGSGEKWP